MKWQICAAPLLLVAAASLAGCGSEAPPEKAAATVVYIDTRTQEIFRLPQQSASPATNPSTGQKTLAPGLYCPKCAKWYPAPPFEVLQRTPSAFLCRKCQTRMTPEEPK